MSRTSSGGSSKGESDAAAVLDFWFGDSTDPGHVKRRGRQWFAPSEAYDRAIRERFGTLHDHAQRGGLEEWTCDPDTALALVLLLDQFTRNLYRGTASAFANDTRARAISRDFIERGFDRALDVVRRVFVYMPFQHSESIEDQRESVRLFEALAADSPAPFELFARDACEYAVLHRDLVERFGRFPHRNELLGRPSTEDERRYLEEGGHRFGQG